MPPPVSQDFLEDALAVWERLRRWTDLNAYLTALRSQSFHLKTQYEREPYSLRLARRVNEVVDRLSAHSDTLLERDITPRGALLALAADVRLCLTPLLSVNIYDGEPDFSAVQHTSTSSSSLSSPPSPGTTTTTTTINTTATTNDGDHGGNGVDAQTPEDAWAKSVQNRTVSGVTVMEGLHILTCPGVQLRINANVARLRERVHGEMGGKPAWVSRTRTSAELHALRATALLLDDFIALYERVLPTFACLRVMGSSHVPVALLPLLLELYCDLGMWVLEADTAVATTIGPRVQSFEPKKLKVMLRRPSKEIPWGLRFNQQGKLIGVSAMVRAASIAGERLHKTVQASREGVKIHRYNTKAVDFTMFDAAGAVKHFEQLSPKQTRVYLTLKTDTIMKRCAKELAFFTTSPTPPPQVVVKRNNDKRGKEGSGNHVESKGGDEPNKAEQEQGECQRNTMSKEEKQLPRATLVLLRDDYNISWDMAVTRDLVIVNVPTNILSSEAQAFFDAHPRQVHISAINGVEVTNPVQVEALSSVVNTLVLDVYCGAPSMVEKEGDTEDPAPKSVRRSKAKVPADNSIDASHSGKTGARPKGGKAQSIQQSRGIDSKKVLESNISEDPLKLSSQMVTPSNMSVGANVGSETKPKQPKSSSSSSSSTLDDIMATALSFSKDSAEYKLSDDVLAALKENSLLPLSAMRLSTTPLSNGSKELGKTDVHDSDATLKNHVDGNPTQQKEEKMLLSTKTTSPGFPCEGSTPSIDDDGVGEPAVNVNRSTLATTRDYEWENLQASPTTTSALNTTATPGVDAVEAPLIFPNDVTLDTLTLDEMVLRRQSAEKKWGLSLETAGDDSNRAIRVVALPNMNAQLRQHPFYKLFHTYKDNWCIKSVNGTPASKLPEVLDIMKHTLKIQIKFQRKWR